MLNTDILSLVNKDEFEIFYNSSSARKTLKYDSEFQILVEILLEMDICLDEIFHFKLHQRSLFITACNWLDYFNNNDIPINDELHKAFYRAIGKCQSGFVSAEQIVVEMNNLEDEWDDIIEF